jgi:hypothetical protein
MMNFTSKICFLLVVLGPIKMNCDKKPLQEAPRQLSEPIANGLHPRYYTGTSVSKSQNGRHTSQASNNMDFVGEFDSSFKLSSKEDLADQYYTKRIMERRERQMEGEFLHIQAHFPCIYGELALGDTSEISLIDGHKYVCGVSQIPGAPIVYSFGSGKLQMFELAFLRERPDAHIFIFEALAEEMIPKADQDPRIHYYQQKLGYKKGCVGCKSVLEIMRMLKHTYIDVLKMDVEGYEWAFMDQESKAVMPHVGQYLVEIHKGFAFSENRRAGTFLAKFEGLGFRLFRAEGNIYNGPHCCAEWFLIRANWESWNSQVRNSLGPLRGSNSSVAGRKKRRTMTA